MKGTTQGKGGSKTFSTSPSGWEIRRPDLGETKEGGKQGRKGGEDKVEGTGGGRSKSRITGPLPTQAKESWKRREKSVKETSGKRDRRKPSN